MKTQSELKVLPSGNYKYIYVYFQLNGQTIRINTKYLFEGKRYHLSSLLFSSNKAEYEKLNAEIISLKNNVDRYISKALEYDLQPNQSDCKKYLSGKLNLVSAPKSKTTALLNLYSDFLEFKKSELLNQPSTKDYISLQNALTDFQLYLSRPIFITDLNSLEVIWEFRNFLLNPHNDIKYITKGGLNNNTINKRLSSLRSFMLWIERKGIFTFDKVVYEQNLKSFRPSIIALDKQELKELFAFEPNEPFEQRILDIFKLNCLMGLRYSDLATFSKGQFVVNGNNQMFYLKTNEKTDTQISVPVVQKAREILEKYDFQLKVITNQAFNRSLKDILKKYDLLGSKVLINELRGTQIVSLEKDKRDCISTHTARRTYITLALQNNIPLNALMGSTGHTQLSTLQKYAAKNQNFDDFDRLNNF